MILKNKKNIGSALIIALLMMGILMTLALGLSSLVIREVRITADIVHSEKAYYAAESGIESGLLDLHQNLPGFQVEGGSFPDEDLGLDFQYSLKNKTKVLPFVDTDIVPYAVAQNSPRQYLYNKLDLNQTVMLPLFVADEDNNIVPITEFRVEYFIDADIAGNYGGQIERLDILRWKITGIKNDEGANPEEKKYFTETIGDYLPPFAGGETTPSCFGTDNAYGAITVEEINYTECAKYYPFARESYTYVRDTDSGELITTKRDELNPITISDFLTNHRVNYLTISNLFNPAVLEGLPEDQKNRASIYYRIIVPRDEEFIVRDYAKISSTGFDGKLRHQLEALVSPKKFLPVFTFSLYRTDINSDDAL